MENEYNFITILLISFAAGGARIAEKLLRGEKVLMTQLFAQVFLSGFVGWIAGQLAIATKMSFAYGAIAIGISGYLGAEIVKLFPELFKRLERLLPRMLIKFIAKFLNLEVSETDLEKLDKTPEPPDLKIIKKKHLTEKEK